MGIKAELHGKISSSGNNITDALEDLLTSNVFQLLRYVSLDKGLLPVLGEAVNLDGYKLDIPYKTNEAEIYFWKLFSNSEPDIFIELKCNDLILENIMVEAKYLSGKSGLAIYDQKGNEQFYIAGSDQLEREFNDLKDYSSKKQIQFNLVYLTMDWVFPNNDIADSVSVIGDYSRKNIYWLSWQSINTVLTGILQDRSFALSKPEIIVLHDIIDLLEKKGLKEFKGINIPTNNVFEPFKYFNLLFYEHIPFKEFESLKYFEGGSNE